jgi:heavy metal-binding protein
MRVAISTPLNTRSGGACCGREAMSSQPAGQTIYTCPMHRAVRQSTPGTCPKCGMALLPEGTRFAIVRHMVSSPMHIAAMAIVMLAIMGALMMMAQ